MALGLGRFLGRSGPVVPLVRLSGVIGGAGALRPGLTLEQVARPLEQAFGIKAAPVVAIAVNSPGGSPVQSHLIYRRIRALAEQKNKPVLMFLEDVAASGGYLIALAGDEIIADPSSIVGSIGVVSAGFGFTGLIDKLGIERRVYTAGSQKVMLDPFQAEKPEDVEHLKELQREVHATFVDLVRSRRPSLPADRDLFTGAFWTGGRALEFGLVDRLGDVGSVLRTRFGARVRVKPIGPRRSFLQRRFGARGGPSGDRFAEAFAGALAARSADAIMAILHERSLWSRFGL